MSFTSAKHSKLKYTARVQLNIKFIAEKLSHCAGAAWGGVHKHVAVSFTRKTLTYFPPFHAHNVNDEGLFIIVFQLLRNGTRLHWTDGNKFLLLRTLLAHWLNGNSRMRD